MVILDNISSLCTDPGLANILAIIKKFMNILWIVGPILAIISAVIIAIKLMSNPEEKKYKPLFKNCIMALLFVFFIPLLVNVVMGLLDSSFEVAACWNQAESVSTNGQNSGYIDEGKDKTGGFLTDPDAYEPGSDSTEIHLNTWNRIRYNIYNQADSRWGSTKYDSGNTIEEVGCMITAIAVVSSAYNGNITPLTVFNSGHRHNHPRNAINGLTAGAFNCTSGNTASGAITSALRDGQVVVIKVYGSANGGSSSFTNSQHYMALIDINGNKIFVGNAYSDSGYGKAGWYDSSKVLTSVQSADYCTATDSLKSLYGRVEKTCSSCGYKSTNGESVCPSCGMQL